MLHTGTDILLTCSKLHAVKCFSFFACAKKETKKHPSFFCLCKRQKQRKHTYFLCLRKERKQRNARGTPSPATPIKLLGGSGTFV